MQGRCGPPELSVGIAEVRAGEDVERGLERARVLTQAAEEGSVAVAAALRTAADRRHTLGPPVNDALGKLDAASLSWPPGSEPAVALPATTALALDRPWPMLGRSGQLVEIGEAWARAAAGGGGAVVLAGEPGIGKSRLLAEAIVEIQAAGGTILLGVDGESNPFSYGAVGEALSQLRSLRPELLPEPSVSRALQSVDPGGAGRAGMLGDERGVLFDAVAATLERAAAEGPVTLALEDLHEGASSALALVSYLARRELSGVLILCSYRATEIEAGGDHERALLELRSAPATRHLALDALSREELVVLTRSFSDSAGEYGATEVAEMLAGETGGNPLYASVLLSSGAATEHSRRGEGPNAPRSLRMLIEERARSLGESAFGHLRAAALAGRRFRPETIAAALGVDPGQLDESLLAAERSGLLARVGDGAFEFSHALTATCLAEGVGAAEAGRLHRALAEELERSERGSEGPAGLARHWALAQPPDPERALGYAREAGDRAMAGLDHEAAAGWFRRALELYERTPSPTPELRCELLLGLGGALRFSGLEFREILLEAGRLALELGDDQRLVAAALANSRGFTSVSGGLDRERASVLEQALERMGPEPTAERALVLAQLANELTFTEQSERRGQLAGEALEVARAAGDDRMLARVLIRTVLAEWTVFSPERRISDTAEAVAIATRLDEPLDRFHGLHWQGMALFEAARLDEASALLAESRSIAVRLDERTALWLAECARAGLAMARGNLAAAEAGAEEALKLGQGGSQPDALLFYASQLAGIRWHQGRLGELAPLLADALEQNPGLPGLRSLVVLAHATTGASETATRELRVHSASGFRDVPKDPIWMPVLVAYGHAVAELAAGGIDRLEGAAADLRRLVEPYAGRLSSSTVSTWGLTDHCLGRLAGVCGETDLAREQLERSIEIYERIGAAVWRGLALRHLAELEAGTAESRKEAARAERLRAEAVDLGLELGAAELVRTAGQPAAEAIAVTERAGDGRTPAGLTGRQAEVARLAAAGLSNQAIAEQLVVSPHTVKRHLEDVYRVLGVSGRRELERRGLRPAADSPD